MRTTAVGPGVWSESTGRSLGINVGDCMSSIVHGRQHTGHTVWRVKCTDRGDRAVTTARSREGVRRGEEGRILGGLRRLPSWT